jgi:hypothetical protein
MSDAIPPYPNQVQDPTTPTQILAVDSTGRLTANQGAAAALTGAWPTKITDGTNVMPTGDAVGRPIYVRQTDGTNTQPTADVAARAMFQKVTDGTNTATVGTLTTAAVGFNTVNLGVYVTTPPTLTNGQVYPLRVDATGALVVSATISTSSTVNQGTAAALSSAWPVKVTDGTNVMPTGDAVGRAIFQKVTDGTSTATVGTLTTSAVGLNVVPLGVYQTTPPSLTNGQVYPLTMDASGRLLVSTAAATRRLIELSYVSGGLSILVANMWRNVLTYTVPASYQLEVTNFNCSAGNQLSSARWNRMKSLGTYNVATSTFSDGSAYTSPGFCSSVEAEVTVALTGTAVTLTVTYVNQDGVAGRTGTITCTAAAPLQYRFLMTLQGTDFGVRDITAVTKSGGTAGTLTLYGLTTLMQVKITNADQTYPYLTARESVIIEAGDMVSLEVTATSATNVARMVKAVGVLSPT